MKVTSKIEVIVQKLIGLGLRSEDYAVIGHDGIYQLTIEVNLVTKAILGEDRLRKQLLELIAEHRIHVTVKWCDEPFGRPYSFFLLLMGLSNLEQGHDLTAVPKVLRLTVKQAPFEVMITGEKRREFRKHGGWIASRLYNPVTEEDREYDLVEIRHGYGMTRPVFWCEYRGYLRMKTDMDAVSYSNGLVVEDIGKDDWVIFLGPVMAYENFELPPRYDGEGRIWQLAEKEANKNNLS